VKAIFEIYMASEDFSNRFHSKTCRLQNSYNRWKNRLKLDYYKFGIRSTETTESIRSLEMSGYTIHATDSFHDTLGVEEYVRIHLQSKVDAGSPIETTQPGLDIAPLVAFLRRNIYEQFPVTFNAHDYVYSMHATLAPC
jgi:hypothetical protein